ncbi:hypothetical protein Fcan01_14051 [Folsomia candida]|uniref:O-acyltransferase WSD1 C-terminal domain-containing protein n=1 Tax=Folsomia candida TaxID=158441 RepID=A0A226DZE5_FOLCA|nr:hypothetical protein Fcan01_14051 [Folsomia candida]
MDHHESSLSSSPLSLRKKRREFSKCKSFSAAPFILYRSTKYSSLRSRIFDYVTSARTYLSGRYPKLRSLLGTTLLYHVAVGILLPLVCLPILLVSFCESDFVTSLIWVKGDSLDVEGIRSGLTARIQAPSSPLNLLGRVLSSRLRVLVWEQESSSRTEFNISNHVALTDSKFHGIRITDDPVRELGGGSVLQKYVSEIVSSPLKGSVPPWGVNLVQLSSRENPGIMTTLIVLRFHRLLLKERAIVAMFLSSLGQKGALLEVEQAGSGTFIPCELEGGMGYREEENKCWKDKSRLFWMSMAQGIESFLINCENWITLRTRQAEFNSRLALGKLVLFELSDTMMRKSAQISKILDITKKLCSNLWQIFRAILYIPSIVVKIYVANRSPNRIGLYYKTTKSGEMCNSVSWSRQLSVQFLHEISNKIISDGNVEGTESSIFLTAVSLALKDYYLENCIPNPVTIGATVSSASNTSYSTGQKLVELPTRLCDIPKELKNLAQQVDTFTAWKQLALSYLVKFSSAVLPQSVAYSLVEKKLGNYYPIHVTLVDTQSSFPNLTFWGHPVKEFTFWKHPQSNLCISITLIKYGGNFRLCVSSPMKSVDHFISRRFPQYLNQIAESVGVDRGKIPYSKKSSPLSSNASSRGDDDENQIDDDGSVFVTPNCTKIGGTRFVRRVNSCQNLR